MCRPTPLSRTRTIKGRGCILYWYLHRCAKSVIYAECAHAVREHRARGEGIRSIISYHTTHARPGPGAFTRSSRKFLPKNFPRAATAAVDGFVRPGPGSFVLARRKFENSSPRAAPPPPGPGEGVARPKPGTFNLPKRQFLGSADLDSAGAAGGGGAASGFVRPPRGSFRLPDRQFRARSAASLAGNDPASPPARTAFVRPPFGSFRLRRLHFSS